MLSYRRIVSVLALSPIFFGFTKQLPVYQGEGVSQIDKSNTVLVGSTFAQVDGESKIEALLWDNQDELMSEILDAIGDYKISSTIVDHNFDLDGKSSTIKIKPILNPKRNVRIVSKGSITDGQPSSDFSTQFMISDAMTAEIDTHIDVNLNKYIPLQAMRYEGGVSVQKISYTNSYEDYVSKNQSPADSLKNFVNIQAAEEGMSQAPAEIEKQSPQIAEQIYQNESSTSASGIIQNLSDEERTKIFFEGFFDPYKVARKFAFINAEKLKDDKILKPGETLIKTYFRKYGPGIGLSHGVFSSSLNHLTFEYLRVGFEKIAPGQLLVKTQIDQYVSFEIDFDIGLGITSFKPQRSTWSRGYEVIHEHLYQMDLNTPAGLSALNDLVEKTNVFGSPESQFGKISTYLPQVPGEGPHQGVELLMDKKIDPLGATTTFNNKTELGFLTFKNQSHDSLADIRTQTSDGKISDEVIGDRQHNELHRLRLFGHNFNDTNCRKFGLITRPNDNNSFDTDIGFEYCFEDTQTSQADYQHTLGYIDQSLFSSSSDNQNSDIAKIKSLLEQRMVQKAAHDDFQSINAQIYFSQDFIKKILNQKPADVQTLVAQMILGPNATWAQIRRLGSYDISDICWNILTKEAQAVLFDPKNPGGYTCNRVSNLAKKLVNTFTDEIVRNADDRQASKDLKDLVTDVDVRPFVPKLMLEIGLLQSFDAARQPLFDSVESAVAKNQIEIDVRLAGQGIEGAEQAKTQSNVNVIKPTRVDKDFLLRMPLSSDPLLSKVEIIADTQKSKIYVHFFSRLQTQPGYKLEGTIYEDKMIFAGEPVAQVEATNLISIPRQDTNGITGYDNYVEFPWVNELQQNNEYDIQLNLQNQNGLRMTQGTHVKFGI